MPKKGSISGANGVNQNQNGHLITSKRDADASSRLIASGVNSKRHTPTSCFSPPDTSNGACNHGPQQHASKRTSEAIERKFPHPDDNSLYTVDSLNDSSQLPNTMNINERQTIVS
jgi:hypothetical protein